jgi:spore coat polysaccharide biosynthesis predicted glycosyltransferase SpsG/CMP-N-acetylneuraminic acid synthetase
MNSSRLTILIPALKKIVAFQDDLVKKLAGISLIQRSINIAVELCEDKSSIHLLTDSEEVSLIAERNGIQHYLDSNLVWNEVGWSTMVSGYLEKTLKKNEYTLILSPYSPLLTADMINVAKQGLINSKREILKPVRTIERQLYDKKNQSTFETIFGNKTETHSIESKAFVILKTELLKIDDNRKRKILIWPIEHELLEIESYQDWWVCEKLIKRKRIVFRVIGSMKVGMGHIYRSLSLAHEITDHEILFVSDHKNVIAVSKFAGYDYWLGIYDKSEIVQQIINLKPDIVINDILSTDESDVRPLKKYDIKVVNFEDLGDGSRLADIVINELYDLPLIDGNNYLWGHNYFFLRGEFDNAKPHQFKKHINTILISFGGTDQYHLSLKVFKSIKFLCEKRNIKVNIVTGYGYQGYDELKDEVSGLKYVNLTRSTGVISKIMEQCQVAIVANGRTVYELAHLNIPAIVISQHQREKTHTFAFHNNGFVPIGVYKPGETEQKVHDELIKLVDDAQYRKVLFQKLVKYNFSLNKVNVLDSINSLI